MVCVLLRLTARDRRNDADVLQKRGTGASWKGGASAQRKAS